MKWAKGELAYALVGLLLVYASSIGYAFVRGSQWTEERYLRAQDDAWYYQDAAERCLDQNRQLEEQAALSVIVLLRNAETMARLTPFFERPRDERVQLDEDD